MIVCIVGVGLLGGSFALALKEAGIGTHFIGVDTNAANAAKAAEIGLVNEVLPFAQAMALSDLVVLATPVNALVQQLPQALDLIKGSAIVTDLGSTKELICKTVKEHPKRARFVAAHPMAGTENSGPTAAFPSLFKRKMMIICEKEHSAPDALDLIEKICHAFEMRVSYMDAADHDRHLSFVSHLSHITSFALGATVLDIEKDEKSIFNMASSGFSSTVRLAKSSPEMWAPIFTQNTKNISEALDAYIRKLQYFKQIIDAQDEASTTELMRQANDIRRVLKGIDLGTQQ